MAVVIAHFYLLSRMKQAVLPHLAGRVTLDPTCRDEPVSNLRSDLCDSLHEGPMVAGSSAQRKMMAYISHGGRHSVVWTCTLDA